MAATRPPVTSHVLDTARYSDDARSAIRGTDIEQGDAWVRHVSHTLDDVVKWRVSEGDTNVRGLYRSVCLLKESCVCRAFGNTLT